MEKTLGETGGGGSSNFGDSNKNVPAAASKGIDLFKFVFGVICDFCLDIFFENVNIVASFFLFFYSLQTSKPQGGRG